MIRMKEGMDRQRATASYKNDYRYTIDQIRRGDNNHMVKNPTDICVKADYCSF